jgi:hypothetical protein
VKRLTAFKIWLRAVRCVASLNAQRPSSRTAILLTDFDKYIKELRRNALFKRSATALLLEGMLSVIKG